MSGVTDLIKHTVQPILYILQIRAIYILLIFVVSVVCLITYVLICLKGGRPGALVVACAVELNEQGALVVACAVELNEDGALVSCRLRCRVE